MNPFGVTNTPTTIDTAALLEFNRGTKRARLAYRTEHSAEYRDWVERTKRAARDKRRNDRRRVK